MRIIITIVITVIVAIISTTTMTITFTTITIIINTFITLSNHPPPPAAPSALPSPSSPPPSSSLSHHHHLHHPHHHHHATGSMTIITTTITVPSIITVSSSSYLIFKMTVPSAVLSALSKLTHLILFMASQSSLWLSLPHKLVLDQNLWTRASGWVKLKRQKVVFSQPLFKRQAPWSCPATPLSSCREREEACLHAEKSVQAGLE